MSKSKQKTNTEAALQRKVEVYRGYMMGMTVIILMLIIFMLRLLEVV